MKPSFFLKPPPKSGRFKALFSLPKAPLRTYFFEKGCAPFDLSLLLCVLALGAMGTVMIYSAGYAYAAVRYDDPNYFIRKQTVWLVLGIACMLLACRIRITLWEDLSGVLYIGTLLLLVLVLVIGFTGNGAQRWISIGPLTLQPSEFAKLTLVLMLARYYSTYGELPLDRKRPSYAFYYGTLYPALLLGVIVVLVMLQKHLSCIIILGLIGLLVMIASGIRTKYISVFSALGAAGVTCLAIFTDYTKERITVWQNPELYRLTGGWQTLQGLMAIGSGGMLGVGFGESVLKYCYISEPANDMIFTVLCEETGFVGAVAVLLTFAFLCFRGYTVAIRSTTVFSRLTAFGITTKMALQVLLNVAVVTNTIPNTGISLPFFSYGGSSLVMLFFEMGILLAISREAAVRN